jgi:hypothetical protein
LEASHVILVRNGWWGYAATSSTGGFAFDLDSLDKSVPEDSEVVGGRRSTLADLRMSSAELRKLTKRRKQERRTVTRRISRFVGGAVPMSHYCQ